MSLLIPLSIVTIKSHQPNTKKIQSLLFLKSFSVPNYSSFNFLKKNNAFKNATNSCCKSLIQASGTTTASVTVEKDVSNGTVFVIRAQDKMGLLPMITRVLKGLKIDKPTIQLDEKEDCFVIKFLVNDLNGNKIEDKENIIKIKNLFMEAINGGDGVVVKKAGFLGGKTDKMFELMDGFLKNDPISLQKDILHHVEYTVARSRFSFDDFEAYQV